MLAQMLAPAAVLIAWSLIMLVWMAATRLPAMGKAGGGLGNARPGGRGQDLEGVLPDKICLLYTSPSPRDGLLSRMPSSA